MCEFHYIVVKITTELALNADEEPISKDMKTRLSSLGILILLGCSSLSGCSQSAYTYSDKDGYVMDYPAVGQDVSAVVQEILNRQGDPLTNRNATNGPVIFKVLSAKVMKADDVVPSADGQRTVIWFHGHVQMTLPNGQVVDCEDFEELNGTWQDKRLKGLGLNTVIGTAYVYGDPPDLYNLEPAYLENLKSSIKAAYNRLTLQCSICDATSIEALFWILRGHDLIHQQYDFTFWKEANSIAMAHADEVFCGSGDALPAAFAPPPPVARAQVPPTLPTKQIIDRFSLLVAPGVLFNVPITDPSWFRYKASLLTPRFDKSWIDVAAHMTRLQLEQRVHDSLAASLKTKQREVHQQNGAYEGHLAQAAYVAGQPGASQAQKDAYDQLSHEGEARLGPSTRYLMASKILVDSIQDDVNSHK